VLKLMMDVRSAHGWDSSVPVGARN
jgi:hypothetical protein